VLCHGSVILVEVVQLFPGLIYRMHKPKVVLLIFVSGKIVLTGAKVRFRVGFYRNVLMRSSQTREDIYTAFNQFA
jgi:hypothetical protein